MTETNLEYGCRSDLKMCENSAYLPKPPKLPAQYIGKFGKNCGYTINAPRKWTQDEIDWMIGLRDKGYNALQIAESLGRGVVSVSIKLKRLGKKKNTYNAAHLSEKYDINHRFIAAVQPTSIADVYCGTANFYSRFCDTTLITNDKDKSIPANYHMDALAFCCFLFAQGGTFDLIDLDPFGSAFDCFDLAIKMAKRALVITFGELGHKRWKRLDFVSRYYGIDSFDKFTLDNLIAYVQTIATRNKKRLIVFDKREWPNIGRVWFFVEPIKIIPWKRSGA